jgi:hypothetical protein
MNDHATRIDHADMYRLILTDHSVCMIVSYPNRAVYSSQENDWDDPLKGPCQVSENLTKLIAPQLVILVNRSKEHSRQENAGLGTCPPYLH